MIDLHVVVACKEIWVSDSPGLVDFAIAQVKFFWEVQLHLYFKTN